MLLRMMIGWCAGFWQPTATLEAVCQMQRDDPSGTRVVFVPSDDDAIAQVIREVRLDETLRRQYAVTALDGTNVAHVLLSVTNYVYSYLKLRPDCNGPINVALDAGDYTQAAAAYYTRLAGVPIQSVTAVSPAPDDAATDSDDMSTGASAHASDAQMPGLERLAFEFCGRDPGRVAAGWSSVCCVHSRIKGL